VYPSTATTTIRKAEKFSGSHSNKNMIEPVDFICTSKNHLENVILKNLLKKPPNYKIVKNE
jgi:hypothetical protein